MTDREKQQTQDRDSEENASRELRESPNDRGGPSKWINGRGVLQDRRRGWDDLTIVASRRFSSCFCVFFVFPVSLPRFPLVLLFPPAHNRRLKGIVVGTILSGFGT